MPLWCYPSHPGNAQETVLNSSCLGIGSYSHCNSNLPPSGVMICTVTAAIVIICINACFLTGLWSLWGQEWCLIHWIYSDSNSQCLPHLTAFACSCPCPCHASCLPELMFLAGFFFSHGCWGSELWASVFCLGSFVINISWGLKTKR